MPSSANTLRHGLVIDDAPELRLLVEAYLRALGLSVTALASGQHALETARRERPALIVLDIMLPNVCGLDLCEQIRRDPELAETPVILMSARISPRDRANAELAGASLFLPKPIQPAELAECVARLLMIEAVWA
jgi:two-component system phosphate regulon response regulator PhoB